MYQHVKQVNTLGKLNVEAVKPAAATMFSRVAEHLHSLTGPLLLAVVLRLFVFATTFDYQADAWQRTLNMMTLAYHSVWPPGYFYLAKPFYVLFGHPNLVLQMMSFVTGVGSVLILYLLVKTITGDRRTAQVAAFFVALLPIHVSFSVQGMSEMPFFFFWIASLYALARRRFLWSAGLLGMATMIRYEAWLFVLAIPVYILFKAVANVACTHRSRSQLVTAAKDAFRFFVVSSLMPLLYMVMNKIASGYYLESYFLNLFFFQREQVVQRTEVVMAGGESVATDSMVSLVSLFVYGLLNIPTRVELSTGQSRYLTSLLDLRDWYDYGLILFALLLGMALLGIVCGQIHRQYRLVLLFALTMSLLFFFQLNLYSVFLPRMRYTFVPLILLTVFAAVGVRWLVAQEKTRLIGRTLAAGIGIGLLIINAGAIYSGPNEPAEVATHLKTLLQPATPSQRLQRSVGLTGPPKQTEQMMRLAGPLAPYLQSLMTLSHEEQVIVIYGKHEPRDTRRLNMIQGLADLSYNQFHRLLWTEAPTALAARPAVVLVVKDSLVHMTGEETVHSLRTSLQAHDYSRHFEWEAFELWTLGKTD